MSDEVILEKYEKVDQLSAGGRYYRLVEAAEPIEITVDEYRKIEASGKQADYALSSTNKDGQTGYYFEILSSENKVLTVNTWGLKNAVEDVFRKAGKIKGVTMKLSRPKKGNYIAEATAPASTIKEIKDKASEIKPKKSIFKEKDKKLLENEQLIWNYMYEQKRSTYTNADIILDLGLTMIEATLYINNLKNKGIIYEPTSGSYSLVK